MSKKQTENPEKSSVSAAMPGYGFDIVDAANQANDALGELDGTPDGVARAHVKIRSMIFTAYHRGREEPMA